MYTSQCGGLKVKNQDTLHDITSRLLWFIQRSGFGVKLWALRRNQTHLKLLLTLKEVYFRTTRLWGWELGRGHTFLKVMTQGANKHWHGAKSQQRWSRAPGICGSYRKVGGVSGVSVIGFYLSHGRKDFIQFTGYENLHYVKLCLQNEHMNLYFKHVKVNTC